jgi:ribosomal protein S18 acetylase RimI-like enzyme
MIKNRRSIKNQMMIRKAQKCDIKDISRLLVEICNVHQKGRPDLFKHNGIKYTPEQLTEIINDSNRPVVVAIDEESNQVLGYALCMFKESIGDSALVDVKTLYIDDLCVDENIRGNHIGEKIYKYLLDFAKESGCYNVTLNVWTCNERAIKFYERCGLKPQKIGMEKIL